MRILQNVAGRKCQVSDAEYSKASDKICRFNLPLYVSKTPSQHHVVKIPLSTTTYCSLFFGPRHVLQVYEGSFLDTLSFQRM